MPQACLLWIYLFMDKCKLIGIYIPMQCCFVQCQLLKVLYKYTGKIVQINQKKLPRITVYAFLAVNGTVTCIMILLPQLLLFFFGVVCIDLLLFIKGCIL